ncbi:MAG: mercury(II) reductase [Chloroflexi bacterium RBG_16_52_11]|nr:MAG: mercury(II) reductase [Chloroflexi bacterium RBG_16_52_11]
MLEQIEFDIRGMTCDSCVLHVERALKKVSGVREAEVPGWESGRASVLLEGDVDSQALIGSVRLAGYGASVKTRKPVVEHRVEKPSSSDGRGNGRFDLMVIGAGSAGFAAAIKGAELGYRVAVVEANTIGGTCVNVGCVPSKTLIRAMEQYHQASQPRFRGVHTLPGELNWAQVIADKDELVAEMRQSKYVDVLAAYPEITYIQGRARLIGDNGVEIDGKAYPSAKILIATGAQPWAPSIPGLKVGASHSPLPYLTSATAMELKELPRSMIVLGANAVGLELAQTFARAGTHVTLLELLPRIAPFEDQEISEALQDYLEEEGLEIVTGFQTTRAEKLDGRYLLTGTQDSQEIAFDAEQLLVATGRRPNTTNLGLEEAGVRLGTRGEILVDETLRTENPHVYAAGDVSGQDMFVYVAAYGGGLAAENALTDSGRVYDASYIPRITFTDPQIASAGLTEEQAREQGYTVRVSSLPMAHVPRALAARDTRGLVKLVADADTDRLLGAHILAPEASEMIQTAVLAIRFGVTLTQLRQTMFPYLTNVEGIKLAAVAFEKDVTLLSCCAG